MHYNIKQRSIMFVSLRIGINGVGSPRDIL